MAPSELADWAKTWREDYDIDRRMKAIDTFGKAVKKPDQWKQCWDNAGGTAGLVELLSLASAREVTAFCESISNCKGRLGMSRERQSAVQELLTALLPQQYPSSMLRSQDKRPLQPIYARMLIACPSDFVQGILQAQDESHPLYRGLDAKELQGLISTHDEMLKRRLTEYLTRSAAEISQTELNIFFKQFVFSQPQTPGDRPRMSASMQFAWKLLEERLVNDCTVQRWPCEVPELELLMSVFRRHNKRCRGGDKTFLVDMGFRLIRANPNLKNTKHAKEFMSAILTIWERFPRRYDNLLDEAMLLGLSKEARSKGLSHRGRDPLISVLVYRWSADPGYYEGLLTCALRQGFAGTEKEISLNYSNACQHFSNKEPNPKLRWQLLRLYCLHVPRWGVDIEASSDFKPLANQHWNLNVFEGLDKEKSVPFLQRLYEANPVCGFLTVYQYHGSSIYHSGNLGPRRNFNVELLITVYRRGSPGALQEASEQVDRLRKTAATSREPEDRALYAKAASHYAIASGDMELYGETILWQQRFIRDYAAARTVFSNDALLTPQGVDLLSGIPSPLPEGMSLSDIRQRLAVANGILKTLNESAKISKGEPKNRHLNWEALAELYQKVFRERIHRAKGIKAQPRGSEPDLFHVIWEGVADLTHSIGYDFLDRVSNRITDLVNMLHGPSLHSATQTLRQAAADWKVEKNASKDHESVGIGLRSLAHRSLAELARRDISSNTRRLIIEEVMGSPEASTWHRQFLSIGIFRNLPAKEAEGLLLDFAAAIGEKLEEQSYVKVGEQEAPKSAPPCSIVKVSTVKYLAQVVKNADFISPDTALQVLLELSKAGTHIDVRIATLRSLLSTFNTIVGEIGENPRSDPVFERIMATLELSVPFAGNVDERLSMSEADWVESKEKLWLPTISAFNEVGVPALFAALCESIDKWKYPNLAPFRAELFARLVLPALKRSQVQCSKWLSVFFAKYGSQLSADALPAMPVTNEMWHKIMDNHKDLVSPSLIAEYNEYILFRMRLPRELQELNHRLKQDASLRNDASVSYWNRNLGQECLTPSIWRYESNYLFELIMFSGPKECQMADLVNAIISQVSLLVEEYEECMDDWEYLVNTLLDPTRPFKMYPDDKEKEKNWPYRCEVTDRLARSLVDLVRKKAAGQSSDGGFLPATFPLCLWSLPYPCPFTKKGQDADYRLFSNKLDLCISSYLGSDEGNVLLWDTLARDVCSVLLKMYSGTVARLRHAVHIGDLEHGGTQTQSIPTPTDFVKVTIALKLAVDGQAERNIRKPKPAGKSGSNPKVTEAQQLAERMYGVMDQWRRGGSKGSATSEGVRDMFLQWRRTHKSTWEAFSSWE
ncbi:hypothetical protein PspLS_02932 [Pyricularia sp. CBS 133598]|nr:hypothetical protein PspLS_02932 [Pyricularia sp. CBS 133598]